jgi:predicted amidohydrolase
MIVTSISAPRDTKNTKAELIKTYAQLCYQASRQGAEIIVLPELSFEYEKPTSFEVASDNSDEPGGLDVTDFLRISEVYQNTIVYGYIETDDSLLYNSACVIHAGRVISNHKKSNLSGPDYLWATESNRLMHNTIAFRDFRMGILIGDDIINHHEYDDRKKPFYNGNLEVICCLTDKDIKEYPEKVWIHLAKTTGANIIVSNKKGNSCVITNLLKVYGESSIEKNIIGGIIQI